MTLQNLSQPDHQEEHWRLLIVDDDASNRQMLRSILEDDYQISFAKNGFQAIELAEKINPDLILLDVVMPEMDGYETCEKLKSSVITSRIPVIFISAKNQTKDEEHGFNVGAVDYITKPVSPSIVRSRVSTHLSLYNQQKAFEFQLQERTRDLFELNEKLANALTESQTANRLKQEFLATMGHELRTPLNGISGSLELLQALSLEKDADGLVDIATRSTKHLNQLLNNILCFIEVQAGDLLLKPKNISLGTLFNHCIEQIDSEEHRIRIDCELDEVKDIIAFLDPERVCIIISHLIDNALKFTEEGSVSVKAALVNRDRECLQIKIKDSGIGFNEDQLKTVWDIFRQGDGTFSRKNQGVGIGLPLVKGLVEVMGGSISLLSEVCKGAEFTITLPLTRGQLEASSETQTQRSKETSKAPIILVVEDNPINMKITQKMLKKMGYESITAVNGKEALEIMATAPEVSLILMDCQMPIMDGYESTSKIRDFDHAADLPIVALTANISDTDVQNCLAAGMNDHMGKPVSLSNLKATISKWLNQ